MPNPNALVPAYLFCFSLILETCVIQVFAQFWYFKNFVFDDEQV
jgi:hypothetical protein